jgi:hypothetical protein
MSVGELKQLLSQYPDDMPVAYKCCSDYAHLMAEEIDVCDAVDQVGYVMRSHPTMSEENRAKVKQFLLFPNY